MTKFYYQIFNNKQIKFFKIKMIFNKNYKIMLRKIQIYLNNQKKWRILYFICKFNIKKTLIFFQINYKILYKNIAIFIKNNKFLIYRIKI